MTNRPALSFSLFAIVAGLAMTATTASAQDGTEDKPPFRADAGEVRLPDLIDRCALYLQRNILWDETEMEHAQAVRLQMPIATDAEGCEELLANVLYRSGFVLTLLDKKRQVYDVVWIKGARSLEIGNRAQHRSTEQILTRPRLKTPVRTVVTLEHVPVQTAANSLRPFLGSAQSTGLTIGSLGQGNNLLLSGIQDQVAAAIRIIEACDVAPPVQRQEQRSQLAVSIAKLEQRLAVLEKKLERIEKTR